MQTDPTISWYLAVAPEIGLAILLFIVLLYNRTFRPESPRGVGIFTAWGSFIILLMTLGLWFFFNEPNGSATLQESLIWGGMMRHDLVTLIFRIMFLVSLMTVSLISIDVERLQRVEYYGLLIAATIGFSLMGAGTDLIMIYVALETASISSYILAAFVKDEERSSEAGMKYFVYGAFATGVMLYGMSLLYGLTGQTNIYAIADFFRSGAISSPIGTAASQNGVILLAAVFIVVGFGFKISAVPFHFWTPDVYQGAPTAFTAFISTASKAAGFAIFIRVFSLGVLGTPGRESAWWAMLMAMCIITMILGNLVAIYQTNIKRMLAYSSVAQAGYAMIGLVTFTESGSGATMFYLLMYIFTNVAAFGVIILVSNVTGSDEVEDLAGLSRRSPYLALVMMFALLSLGGIPPTAGFLGKFFIFKAAVDAGLWGLALIGILTAFVALYYYLNVIKYMYLYRSDDEDVKIPVSRAAQVGLAFSLFFIIFLGVYSGPAFDLTQRAAVVFFG